MAQDGLAQSQVYALLQDSRGYIWSGTQGGGLSRFDGLNFKTFYTKHGNYIKAIEEDSNGLLWIGTDKGLVQYDGINFTIILENELKEVQSILETSDQNIWVGCKSGLWRFDGNSWKNIGEKFGLNTLNVNCFFEDEAGMLWVGSTRGALQFEKNRLDFIDRSFNLSGVDVQTVAQDKDGAIWIGTLTAGVKIINQSDINELNVLDGLSSNAVQSIFKDKKNRMWIGTQDAGVSIYSLDEQSISYLQEHDGLEASDIRAMVQDEWGNYWLGTSGGGLTKCQESNLPFEYFGNKDGLYEREVYAIVEDSIENIWLATARGLFKKSKYSFDNYGETEGFVDSKSRALFYDNEDRLWIGTDLAGLAVFEDGKFDFINSANGLGSRGVKSIAQDAAGNIWAGTVSNGITKIERKDSLVIYYDSNYLDSLRVILGSLSRSDSLLVRQDSLVTTNRLTRFTRAEGLQSLYINCLFFDRENKLWFGTRNGGIGCIQNDSLIRTISTENGLPDKAVRSITADANGNLWLGTATTGISRIEFNKDTFEIRSYGIDEGLFSENIYLLKFDEDQNLWAGNQSGVDRIAFDEAANITEVQRFGIEDGFEGGETCQNAVYQDQDGFMWFGTMNGLMKHIPGRKFHNPQAPSLHFESIQLFYKDIKNSDFAPWSDPWKGLKEGLVLPHNQNSLGFSFKGINHSNPAKITYQWQLKGYEKEWSPVLNKSEVSYSNLPPGEYEFLLRAYNESGVTNDPPLNLAFEIKSPFWQRWWFRIASVLALALLIGSLFRFRINQERKKAKEERSRLELEKNLLLLEQKALQLQMNPHFIFNALNTIQNLIGQNDNQNARYQLAKFSKLMRLILENSRESTIPLELEINTLENYMALEKFSRGNSFEYEIIIDELIDPESVHIPPMLVQPFLENAIIHGVAHRKEGGKITLEFKEEEARLVCHVTDNGIGRAKAAKLKSQIEQQHKSIALTVTKERLDNLFPNRKIKNSLSIVDLKNEKGEVNGTAVQLVLPMLIK